MTKLFMLACVSVYCLLVLLPDYSTPFQLWPLQSQLFQPWQLLTYALLHGNFQHLFFNMLGVWMFGIEIERVLGQKRYALLLVVSVLSAAATHLVLNQFIGPTRLVGASGALFGLLLAYAVFFADRIVEPVFPPIPMKTKYFVGMFGLIELVSGVYGSNGIAHFAHLGGMLGAWLLLRHWRSPPRRR